MNSIITKNIFPVINKVYFHQIKDFQAWLKENTRPFTEESIKSYFKELPSRTYTRKIKGKMVTKKYSAGTVNIKRSAVKKLVNEYYKNSDIETRMKIKGCLETLDQDIETRSIKISGRGNFDKVVSDTEYNRLILAATPRQAAFIRFLFNTGCRISEALSVTLESLNLIDGYYYFVITGKGKKSREIFLEARLIDDIKSVFSSKVYLFETSTGRVYNRCYISNQIKKLGKRVLKKNISAHTFRHSYCTRMIPIAGIELVSEFVGHSSLDITQRYSHNKLNPEHLKQFRQGIA